jgi:hypothetical protein
MDWFNGFFTAFLASRYQEAQAQLTGKAGASEV